MVEISITQNLDLKSRAPKPVVGGVTHVFSFHVLESVKNNINTNPLSLGSLYSLASHLKNIRTIGQPFILHV